MSFEGYSMNLLSAIGVSDEQLLQITSRYQGRLPNAEADYQDMLRYLRRMGHILEGTPGNVGSVLRNRQSTRHYLTNDDYSNLDEQSRLG